MIKVKKITQTCSACPAQWEGEAENGQSVYVRFRHGVLRVDVDGESVVNKHCDGDGVMSYDELKLNTYGAVLFPDLDS